MGKHQRTKGAGGEREVCKILSEAAGRPVKRHLGQARDGGWDISYGRFAIEVKRRKSFAFLRWMQNLIDSAGDRTPVLVLREDGGEWYAVLRLSDFIAME